MATGKASRELGEAFFGLNNGDWRVPAALSGLDFYTIRAKRGPVPVGSAAAGGQQSNGVGQRRARLSHTCRNSC